MWAKMERSCAQPERAAALVARKTVVRGLYQGIVLVRFRVNPGAELRTTRESGDVSGT